MRTMHYDVQEDGEDIYLIDDETAVVYVMMDPNDISEIFMSGLRTRALAGSSRSEVVKIESTVAVAVYGVDDRTPFMVREYQSKDDPQAIDTVWVRKHVVAFEHGGQDYEWRSWQPHMLHCTGPRAHWLAGHEVHGGLGVYAPMQTFKAHALSSDASVIEIKPDLQILADVMFKVAT